MPLSLQQTSAIAALAAQLYDYLPGSSPWGSYTFAMAAAQHGIVEYWPGGSKLPAITHLLETTLERRSGVFCPLLQTIVREGLKYRRKSGSPMTREDLADLNGLIADVGFKIPELWDPKFAASLPARPKGRAAADEAPAKPKPDERQKKRAESLAAAKQRFLALHTTADRQAAGLALERILYEVFDAFELSPRGSFVVLGEQIDGSIVLDDASYLVEAKWEAGPIGLAPLLVFREKVAGKSSFTRGIFISINGYDEGARNGITQGKQPNFLMLDGHHLYAVVDGQEDLILVLRALLRELADTGRPHVTLPELRNRR